MKKIKTRFKDLLVLKLKFILIKEEMLEKHLKKFN